MALFIALQLMTSSSCSSDEEQTEDPVEMTQGETQGEQPDSEFDSAYQEALEADAQTQQAETEGMENAAPEQEEAVSQADEALNELPEDPAEEAITEAPASTEDEVTEAADYTIAKGDMGSEPAPALPESETIESIQYKEGGIGTGMGNETLTEETKPLPKMPKTAMPAPQGDSEVASSSWANDNDSSASSASASGDKNVYIAEPGDTLGRIAQKIYGTTSRWRSLADLNGISNPNMIHPGDAIHYKPGTGSKEFASAYSSVKNETVVVQPGDTLGSIAAKIYGKSDFWQTLWKLNQDKIPNPHRIPAGITLKYYQPRQLTQALLEARSATASIGH